MSRLPARAASLLALLTLACGEDEEPIAPPPDPPVVNECDGLEPLALKAEPARLRVSGVVTLTATGGSGFYRYRVEPGGSQGEMRGDRYVAGLIPSHEPVIGGNGLSSSGRPLLFISAIQTVSTVPQPQPLLRGWSGTSTAPGRPLRNWTQWAIRCCCDRNNLR